MSKFASKAAEEKSPDTRVQELRAEGKNDKEIAVIMKNEGYNFGEIMKALKMNPQQLKELLKGEVKDNKQEENTTERMSQKEYEPVAKTQDVQTLERLLRATVGINPNTVRALIEEIDANYDFYAKNPMELYAALQNAGISNQRAQNIVHTWLQRVNPQAVPAFTIMAAQAGGISWPTAISTISQSPDEFDKMLDRMIKLQSLQLVVRPREEERKADIFDRAEEAYMMKKVFGGDGANPIPHMETETEPLRDESGKIVKDENGNVIYVTRTRKYVAETEKEGREEDNLDKWLDKYMKFQMIRMLTSQNQQPMYPASIEMEPLLDKDGNIVTDKFGNPVMRTKQVPVFTQSQNQGSSDKLAEVAIELAKRPQEGSNTNTELIKILTDTMTSLNTTLIDKVSNLTQDEVNILKERLDNLESQDPINYITAVIDKMKELGVWGVPEDREIKKMELDLKKWQHEQQTAFNKWVWEQKQAMEDKKYAREQLRQFSQTMSKAIEKIGQPLAEGFKLGYAKTKESAPQQPPRERREIKNLNELTNEELLAMKEEADRAERTVTEAKKKIIEEIGNRGLQI